ncbi:histidine kinase [Streptomyces sp. SID11385]|uniref:histidine kinase n=1 Tax=Streptomyces sp. SID11385 TaxID=2706031 RepID=UPI0013CAE1DE|nr:sensor histidine kinase [Streptomyces sp. SID11385]
MALSAPALRLPRAAAGTLLGCLLALPFAAYLLVRGPVLPVRGPGGLAGCLARADRVRRERFFGDAFPPGYEVPPAKLVRHLAHRATTGALTAVVLALLGFGAVLAVLLLRGLVRGSVGPGALLAQVVLGGALLFLAVQGVRALARDDARAAYACFAPGDDEELRRRLTEITASRAAVIRAVDSERRRIERDVHDGVQQRLVALSLLLGRAARPGDPARAEALLAQAREECRAALTELREVAWRVYPSALEGAGLREALEGIAARSPLPLAVRWDVAGDIPEQAATAAYFVVSEAVTNTLKHAGASRVGVVLRRADGVLTVRVDDDGHGGADPSGSGLAGLHGRLAALGGSLRVHSPAGGPTHVVAEVPCA